MPDEEKKDKPKKEKSKPNTMDITLINEAGKTITATGPCSDIEIKSICKSLQHRDGQRINITK